MFDPFQPLLRWRGTLIVSVRRISERASRMLAVRTIASGVDDPSMALAAAVGIIVRAAITRRVRLSRIISTRRGERARSFFRTRSASERRPPTNRPTRAGLEALHAASD